MASKRKICFVTGSRAEYGLLYWLMKEIEADEDLELQIVATGTHLAPEFGLTYKQIESDGFYIDLKVEMLLSSDTAVGISKSMGLAIIGFAEAFAGLSSDMLVVLGDRYEIMSAATAATIARIPIVHLHGGELTEGAYDDAMRHSITKMSHIHFTSTEAYRDRVIQLGEQPSRVFNYGALGVENIKRLKLLSRQELEIAIGFEFGEKNLLVTYHPETLGDKQPGENFRCILDALEELEDTRIIFTKANADTDGRIINQMIDNYVVTHPSSTIAHSSLGQLKYLSCLKYVDGVVGNSSSGIIEAPSLNTGTINIGDRQKGRIRGGSVIDCRNSHNDIKQSLETLYKPEFRKLLENSVNPYDSGETADKITQVIRNVALDQILRKKFFDIKEAR